MVMGRPREHDRNAIAQELIEWSKLPDSTNLNGFCCSRNPPLPPTKIFQWAKECDYFRQCVDCAKAALAERREKMLNMDLLHAKAYDINARVYDAFLKDEVRQHAEFESKLKTQETESATETQKEGLNALLSQLSKLQKGD